MQTDRVSASGCSYNAGVRLRPALFVTFLLIAGSAFAQGQAIVGISTVTTYSADARITAVDPANRTVTLAFTNGATAVRQVSPSVANFAQTKVGDMVSLGISHPCTTFDRWQWLPVVDDEYNVVEGVRTFF